MTDLSVSQVSVILKCSLRTARNLVTRGVFPNAYKLDPTTKSVYRIPRSDIEAFQKLQKVQKAGNKK